MSFTLGFHNPFFELLLISASVFGPTWDPAVTGAQLQVVTMVPFKYGITSSEASRRSWVFCRIQAFASQAAFSKGNSLVCVGGPVVGFVEPTNKGPKSAQLTGWSKTSLEFWRLSSPDSPPIRFDLNPNAIYCLPQLSGAGFAYLRPPRTDFLFLDNPERQLAPAAPSNRDPSRAASRRGRDRGKLLFTPSGTVERRISPRLRLTQRPRTNPN